MKERQPGCICELHPETGEPLVANYAECPVHRPDAPSPKEEAERIVEQVCLGKALIADKVVDEILSVLDTVKHHEYAKVLIPFYQKVKEEINSL